VYTDGGFTVLTRFEQEDRQMLHARFRLGQGTYGKYLFDESLLAII
jgi:hypothetical protein